jgi:dTDP-4-dehydrorhamnose reductase
VKRLLVTGVSGLLGINLAWSMTGRYDVTGVLRGRRAVAVPGHTPFEAIEADLTLPGEVERVLDLSQPDVIIHTAALTEVDRCEMHPEEARRTNTVLPGILARAAARAGVEMLHISTDAVFDGLRGDYSEEDTPNPINVYARTKLDGERAVAEAYPDALIARVNFFGWSWQGSRSLAEFFFNSLSAGLPVFGFDDVFFCPLLVNDLVEILLRMVDLRLKGVYHVVSSECQSKYAFALMLAREFGFDEQLISPAPFTQGNLRAQRSPRLTLRTDRLAHALGAPLPGQHSAIRRYAALYDQKYPQILRSVLVEPNHSPAA